MKTLPPNTVVYRPTKKAIRNGAMKEEDRMVFNGDGTVCFWRGDVLIGSDTIYDRPDSHCEVANEPIPKILYAHKDEIRIIHQRGIPLPFEVKQKQQNEAPVHREEFDLNRATLASFKFTRVYRVGPDGSTSDAKSLPSWLLMIPKMDFRIDEPGYLEPGSMRFWACKHLDKAVGLLRRKYEMSRCVDWKPSSPNALNIGYGSSKELIIVLESKEEAIRLYSALLPYKTANDEKRTD